MIPGWGICLLFWSHPGAFDGLTCPHPRESACFFFEMLMPGGWPGGGGWAPLELTDALLKHERDHEQKKRTNKFKGK